MIAAEPRDGAAIHRVVSEYTYGQVLDVAWLRAAIGHVQAENVPGAVVECGIWRGGMLRAAVLALDELNAQREVWGYDTCTGMTETGPNDVGGSNLIGRLAVPEAEVRAYLGPGVRLVVGDVRETVGVERPAQIAVLRLDVDWYDSTLACLTALWPRLSVGGVLIVDDYNYWQGCIKAVDDYLGPDVVKQMQRMGTGSGLVKVA